MDEFKHMLMLIDNAIETMIRHGKTDEYICENISHVLREYYDINLYGIDVEKLLEHQKNVTLDKFFAEYMKLV